MLEFLKKEVKECVVLCSAIKMWITLKIPRMEDGNDFGVAIQEECVDTITDVEDEAYSILDSISNYYTTRGNYIVQMVSNPSVMDYAKCICQVDETQFFNTKLSIQSFRNNYALLYDLVTKNLEKLQAPRLPRGFSLFLLVFYLAPSVSTKHSKLAFLNPNRPLVLLFRLHAVFLGLLSRARLPPPSPCART